MPKPWMQRNKQRAKKAKKAELLKRKGEREGNKDLLFRSLRLTHSLNRK
tara:strand:+ start:389 stop:535 length:147 start_codon:yes stop_codon:yes gene_type:complete